MSHHYDGPIFVEFATTDGKKHTLQPEQIRGLSGDEQAAELYVTIGESRRTLLLQMGYSAARDRLGRVAQVVGLEV